MENTITKTLLATYTHMRELSKRNINTPYRKRKKKMFTVTKSAHTAGSTNLLQVYIGQSPCVKNVILQ